MRLFLLALTCVNVCVMCQPPNTWLLECKTLRVTDAPALAVWRFLTRNKFLLMLAGRIDKLYAHFLNVLRLSFLRRIQDVRTCASSF